MASADKEDAQQGDERLGGASPRPDRQSGVCGRAEVNFENDEVLLEVALL